MAMFSDKIRIRLKAYDSRILDQSTGEIVEKPIGKKDVARALRADGLATTLGGILNSFPYTCFAENVGLVLVLLPCEKVPLGNSTALSHRSNTVPI